MNRKIIFKLGMVTTFISLSGSALAGPAQVQRFTAPITDLKNIVIGQTNPQTLASRLLADATRSRFFNLESLIRLYQGYDPALSSSLTNVKGLEDSLGNYAGCVEYVQKADDEWPVATRTQTQIDAYQRLVDKRTQAQQSLADLLQQGDWSDANQSPLVTLQNEVTQKFSSLTDHEDMVYIAQQYGRVLDRLEHSKANSKDFDLTLLEGGIHEFRRQNRWLGYYYLALNGAIVLVDEPQKPCPVNSAFEDLIKNPVAGQPNVNTHKFMTFKPTLTVAKPCQISKCLMAEIARADSVLAAIKDDALDQNALNNALNGNNNPSDTATQEATDSAQGILNELRGIILPNGNVPAPGEPTVLEALREQLNECAK